MAGLKRVCFSPCPYFSFTQLVNIISWQWARVVMPLAMFLSFVARCLKPTGVRDNGNKSWEEQQPALELAYKGSRSLGRVDVYSPHAVINFILPFLTSYMLQASLCTRISWVGSLPSDPAAAIGVQSLCLLPNLDLFPHKRSSFCPCLDSSHMC